MGVLARTLSGNPATWAFLCLHCLATAKAMPVLAPDAGVQGEGEGGHPPTCSSLAAEAGLQDVIWAQLKNPSKTPGLGRFCPAEQFFLADNLRPRERWAWQCPLLQSKNAGLLSGRCNDPTDPETLREGKTGAGGG